MKYRCYYDESEHSRDINHSTVTANNYYDNFVTAIVGWSSEYEAEVANRFVVFEDKYADRKSQGEFKSKTIKQSQLQYGFASLNKQNIDFVDDFLSLFDEKMLVYFSATSKMEFVIEKLFQNYHNDYCNGVIIDMKAMKYSIIKAILAYKPDEVIECIYNDTDELINTLKAFFKHKIKQNEANLKLKGKENQAFMQIVTLLESVEPIESTNWQYDSSFVNFQKFLYKKGMGAQDCVLTIDKEGEQKNTSKTAQKVGFPNVLEEDSIRSFGIQTSDLLAGLISKLLKSLCVSLHANSSEENVKKTLLDAQWFNVNERQLILYKKMYHMICELKSDCYRYFHGIYFDDLIAFISLLEFMNHFENTTEIIDEKDMQSEYFNAFACRNLKEYFDEMYNNTKSKFQYAINCLPIEFVCNDSQEFYLNPRGAKVYWDINQQPVLQFTDNEC